MSKRVSENEPDDEEHEVERCRSYKRKSKSTPGTGAGAQPLPLWASAMQERTEASVLIHVDNERTRELLHERTEQLRASEARDEELIISRLQSSSIDAAEEDPSSPPSPVHARAPLPALGRGLVRQAAIHPPSVLTSQETEKQNLLRRRCAEALLRLARHTMRPQARPTLRG